MWALKYRPRTFEKMIGQPERAHLRLMLKERDAFPPLLIFQGPSGTGKTTAARILAAALNCNSLTAKFDPCGECESCKAIQSGDFSGYSEHNAAFKNGAADMRELQEQSFLQSDGQFSCFLLDEAQALSSQAWKVLLKLFEEPPPNTVFILVTSEVQKIPKTILTRALQYNFQKVPGAEIKTRLEKILEIEQAEVDGLDLIVDLADGSVREAIMLLEQCVRGGGNAEELFATRDLSLDFFEALAQKDQAKGLQAIEGMWSATADAQQVVGLLGEQMQRLLYLSLHIPVYMSDATRARSEDVVKSFGSSGLAALLESLAQHGDRARTKTQIVFMWADMSKRINGSVSLARKPVQNEAAKPKNVTAQDAAERLRSL